MPILAVLGVADPADGDWARLRGIQYSTLPGVSLGRCVSQGIAALAVAIFMVGSLPPFALALWAFAVGGSLWNTWRIDQSMIGTDRRRLTSAEVKRQLLGSILNALAWAMPFAAFGFLIDGQILIKMWTVLAILMVGTAMLMPAVPMATILFAAIAGGSAAMLFAFGGMIDMATIGALFCIVVMLSAAENGRRDLVAKVAHLGMAEKDEVVSMLLREFEEGEADWLWQIDTSRRVRSISPRFAFALARNAREIDGQSFIQLISGDAWETGQFPSSLHDLAERLKRREHFSNLLVRVSIAGQARWWELSGTPKFTEEGHFDGFRGVGSDVTEARENSDKIAWLARYDTLTGLPNRTMLTEAISEALADAERWRRRCAFLMIDLDRFKAVNDTLGHHVGDQLLARVSDRLKEQLSENELCGRLGGDEFAIVIRDASDPGHVKAVAERVIQRLSQPYEVDHHTLFVGASVGSALGPQDGATVETLMRNADLALYRAKDAGGNLHYRYEPALHAHAEERRQLEFALRRALDANEFSLVYQPVVDATSEAVTNFEALLRWNNPALGPVSPAKFIPLAEDTRLIVPIGEWVLREACSAAMRWPGHVRVSVNVSGEQLLDHSFAASVVSALSNSGLAPQRLELEVTESVFLRDGNQARAALEQAMALGCKIALDDFGTGYSSLGYLRKLRFSTIKVDRSFVQGAATGNAESLAIIRAVVAMADSLEMSTTAEGVETEKEAALIRQLGCRKIQGFFFGRPMAEQDAEALFRTRHYLSRQSAA